MKEKIMKLSQKIKTTIHENKLVLIIEVDEIKSDMNLNSHYFFKAVNGDLWQAQTDFDVFYKMPDVEYINKIVEIVHINNISNDCLFDLAFNKQAKIHDITLFLKGIFGDTLPGRKAISTVKKYMSEDDLFEYANGRRGISGITASKMFFKTKAYSTFYKAVK